MLLMLCACLPKSVPPEQRVVCLPTNEVQVEHRVETSRVIVELRTTHVGCEGNTPDEITPVAEILLPTTPSSCPIGQVVRRTDNARIVLREVPEFVLSPEVEVAVSRALQSFTRPTSAFVINCEGGVDWLLVEASIDHPGQLFLRNERSFDRHHPRVTFAGEAPELPAVVVSPPPPQAPPECVGLENPTWVGRFFYDGTSPGPLVLETYALRREGAIATLAIEKKHAKKLNGAALEWSCVAARQFTGKALERDGKLLFHFENAAEPADVTCTWRSFKVAAVSAKRVSIPSDQEGCNKTRWAPPPSGTQRVLSCVVKGDDLWRERIFLAAPPGLEHLTWDGDDCWDAADSLRAVPRDGGFAPAH